VEFEKVGLTEISGFKKKDLEDIEGGTTSKGSRNTRVRGNKRKAQRKVSDNPPNTKKKNDF